MDHNVVVSDYSAMDRVLKEERAYILNIVKQIKKSGCNVLLVQKSILRLVFCLNLLMKPINNKRLIFSVMPSLTSPNTFWTKSR